MPQTIELTKNENGVYELAKQDTFAILCSCGGRCLKKPGSKSYICTNCQKIYSVENKSNEEDYYIDLLKSYSKSMHIPWSMIKNES